MQNLSTLSHADVFCVYGVPDREFSRELEGWLEEEEGRFILILEDEEKNLLGFQPFHDRVRMVSATSSGGLKKAAWEFVFLEFDYAKRPGNGAKDEKKMAAIFSQMAFFQNGVHLVASDFKERGLNLLSNFLENSSLFPFAREGKELFGKFLGIPAVICGAGPSLEKEIPYLRTLKDQALLFAGGTTLTSLLQYGISPHFGGVIDPHPPEERLLVHEAHEVPLFFQARAHPSLLRRMQGPLLKISGGGNDFFEEEAFDGGWNVTTFLVALACHLGCSPVILVGVDLAQEKEKCYAGDLSRSEGGEVVVTEEGLWTRKDWLFAAEWLSYFSKTHPEVEWINTSQGLAIEGFEKKALTEIPLAPQADLLGMVHSQIQQIKQGVFPNFSAENLRKSLAHVHQLCTKILALLEKIYPEVPEKNGEYALLELEIEKEMAHQQFLLPVWEVWKPVFARQIPKDVPTEYGIGLNQWLFMQGVCDEAEKI